MKICIVVGIFLYSSVALACEPCIDVLNVEESIATADVIALVYSFENEEANHAVSEREIEVLEVMKGAHVGTVMTVHSWSGMCPYGIVLDKGAYIVLLRSEAGKIYTSLNGGCSTSSLSVVENEIQLPGEKITIEEFMKRFGLNLSPGPE